jgi:hypothetical protein
MMRIPLQNKVPTLGNALYDVIPVLLTNQLFARASTE